MEHDDFKDLQVCAGMKFVVNGEEYWLGQINWASAYLTGYLVKGDETITEFNEMDVDDEEDMDYRMEDTFGCCLVERVFDPEAEPHAAEDK